MARAHSKSALTANEKAIVKSLLNAGERNQDIHALVNVGREATVNFGRITTVKKNAAIEPASDSEVRLYRAKKQKFDHVTGLCVFDDERLVRAKEAMILAVELLNIPRVIFKAGVFVILFNTSWTYLLHEFFDKKGVSIIDKEG